MTRKSSKPCITHVKRLFTTRLITAIDVVKTRIQIDPAYKGLSLLSGAQYVVKTEGPSGLLTGFGPTAVGYLVQVRRFHQMT